MSVVDLFVVVAFCCRCLLLLLEFGGVCCCFAGGVLVRCSALVGGCCMYLSVECRLLFVVCCSLSLFGRCGCCRLLFKIHRWRVLLSVVSLRTLLDMRCWLLSVIC